MTLNTTLDPADDTLVEGDETVTLTLAATSGQPRWEASRRMRSRSWMRIAPRCRWSRARRSRKTGERRASRWLLNTGGNTLENGLTVTVTPRRQREEAADATFGALGSFTFTAGSGNTTNTALTFTPMADLLVEGSELATLTPSGNALNGQVTYTTNAVTILDADSATVAFAGATTDGEKTGEDLGWR